MRRILTVIPAGVAVLALTAVPAIADTATRPEAGTRGSLGGVVLALVLGLLFALAITRFAYTDARFGTDSAHRGEAQDLRDGGAEHETNA